MNLSKDHHPVGVHDARQSPVPRLRILALEPYADESHQSFLDGLCRHSIHRWQIVTLPARHWKWRMRSAPLTMMSHVEKAVSDWEKIDCVFASDMLDLPTWKGLATQSDPLVSQLFAPGLPTRYVTYFHENQWTYPQSPNARVDHHYGYTNLLTALSSDACWFNSRFHLDSFLNAATDFVKRMPDSRPAHALSRLEKRCQVFYPGFELVGTGAAGSVISPSTETEMGTGPIRIGWVARWEYDKRPDKFARLLDCLDRLEVDFHLILLGKRGDAEDSLDQIRHRHSAKILHDGYADSREHYEQLLGQMEVVVSTADHEFFGIAICEAVASGAIPVLPNRLSYPEIFPAECLYETLEDASVKIAEFARSDDRRARLHRAQLGIARLQRSNTVSKIDRAFVATVLAGA